MTDKPTTRRALAFGLFGTLAMMPAATRAERFDDDAGRLGPNAAGYGRGPWYDPRYDSRYESWREAREMERGRLQARNRRDDDDDDDDDRDDDDDDDDDRRRPRRRRDHD